MASSLADAVEIELVRLGRLLTEPGQRECLRCYLIRMLNDLRSIYTQRGDQDRLRRTLEQLSVLAPLDQALRNELHSLGGNPQINMILNPTATFQVLKPTVLE